MPVTNNSVVAGWSGTLGKQVVFRQLNGKTVASAYPDMSKRKLSPKQLNINRLMKEANRYAKDIIANETDRNAAQIRLDIPSNKLYPSLIREYFKINQDQQAEEKQENAASENDNLFIRYLLENTTKSNEEIAAAAKVSVELVEKLRFSGRV